MVFKTEKVNIGPRWVVVCIHGGKKLVLGLTPLSNRYHPNVSSPAVTPSDAGPASFEMFLQALEILPEHNLLCPSLTSILPYILSFNRWQTSRLRRLKYTY